MKGKTIGIIFVVLLAVGFFGLFQTDRSNISVHGGNAWGIIGPVFLVLAVIHLVLWGAGVYGEKTINKRRDY